MSLDIGCLAQQFADVWLNSFGVVHCIAAVLHQFV